MSREATGSHGQILGSLSYFSQINRSTFWGNLQHGEGFDYYRVLRELQAVQTARSTAFTMICSAEKKP